MSDYNNKETIKMKQDIHPKYTEVQVTCSCGNAFTTKSTSGKETMSIDICSQCHPFYTGKQRIVDTAGRVDKFKKRFGGIKKV
jgi:large subunit ribosomal protein L31